MDREPKVGRADEVGRRGGQQLRKEEAGYSGTVGRDERGAEEGVKWGGPGSQSNP